MNNSANTSLNNTPASPTAHAMFSYHKFPIGFLFFIVTGYCVTLVLALTGNLLIILAIYRNVSGKMRSTRNLLIVNMAVSDLTSALFNITDQLRWSFLGNQVVIDGKFGIFLCIASDYVNTLSIDVSLFSLAFITIDRYLGVFFPLKQYFRRRTVWFIVALSWLLPTLYYSPKFFIFDIVDYNKQRSCFTHINKIFRSLEEFLEFTLAHFIIFQVIPVFLMMVLYPSIIFKLWRRQIPGITYERARSRAAANNRRITTMFMIIILSSLICYTPNYVNFYDCFYKGPLNICRWKYASYYTGISGLLFFIPLFINAYIYARFCESFKKAFQEIVQRLFDLMNKCFGRSVLSSTSVYELEQFDCTTSKSTIRQRRLNSDGLTLGTTGTFKDNRAFNGIN